MKRNEVALGVRLVLTGIWSVSALGCAAAVILYRGLRITNFADALVGLGLPTLLAGITAFGLAPLQCRMVRHSSVGTLINFGFAVPACVLLQLYLAAILGSLWDGVLQAALIAVLLPWGLFRPLATLLLVLAFGIAGGFVSTLYAAKAGRR